MAKLPRWSVKWYTVIVDCKKMGSFFCKLEYNDRELRTVRLTDQLTFRFAHYAKSDHFFCRFCYGSSSESDIGFDSQHFGNGEGMRSDHNRRRLLPRGQNSSLVVFEHRGPRSFCSLHSGMRNGPNGKAFH